MAKVTLNEWLNKLEDRSIKGVEKVTNEIFNELLRLNPIDTGRSRWSWEISHKMSLSGSKPLGVLGEKDKGRIFNWTANKASEEVKIPFLAKAAVKHGDDINFMNGVYYIFALEYMGPFKSAPGGMVRRTVRKLSARD